MQQSRTDGSLDVLHLLSLLPQGARGMVSSMTCKIYICSPVSKHSHHRPSFSVSLGQENEHLSFVGSYGAAAAG